MRRLDLKTRILVAVTVIALLWILTHVSEKRVWVSYGLWVTRTDWAELTHQLVVVALGLVAVLFTFGTFNRKQVESPKVKEQ